MKITRLETYFVKPRWVFLKMDTQGWDIEVVRGASGILDKLVGIQSELSAQLCYENMIVYTAS